jgi:hypothetical protein
MPFELASIVASTDRGEIQLDGKGHGIESGIRALRDRKGSGLSTLASRQHRRWVVLKHRDIELAKPSRVSNGLEPGDLVAAEGESQDL